MHTRIYKIDLTVGEGLTHLALDDGIVADFSGHFKELRDVIVYMGDQ